MQIKLCKLHNAKQIIRDKLRKYIKEHQLSQMNGPTRPERAEALFFWGNNCQFALKSK